MREMSLELDFPDRKDRNQRKNSYIFYYIKGICNLLIIIFCSPPQAVLYSCAPWPTLPRMQARPGRIVSGQPHRETSRTGRGRLGYVFSHCSLYSLDVPLTKRNSSLDTIALGDSFSASLYLLRPWFPFGLACNNINSYQSWDVTLLFVVCLRLAFCCVFTCSLNSPQSTLF